MSDQNQEVDPSKSVVTSPGNMPANSGPAGNEILHVHDMSQEMPDLYDTEKYGIWPLDLSSEYWSPQAEGETRRLLFSHVQETLVPDKYGPSKGANGETVLLPTVIFYEMKNGEVKTVRQASKGLLFALQGVQAKMGTVFEIVYKKRTKLPNGNMGDTWGVFPIKVLPPKEPKAETPESN